MNDPTREFLRLFLSEQVMIRGFVSAALRNRAEVDDVFQEVALVLWKKFDDYDPARPFGAWARGIALNKVLQKRREMGRLPAILSPETMGTLSGFYDNVGGTGSMREALRACMRKLSDESRKLLAMRYESRLALKRMAREIGRTVSAVNKALGRIRSSLHECIERDMKREGGVL